jgi:soluble lytic murein transglycosylase-like protein
MRLFVFVLAATALTQPAFARDHAHHRGSAHLHSHHRLSYRHHQLWAHRLDRLGTARSAGAQRYGATPFAQPYQPFTPFVDREPNGRESFGPARRAAAGSHDAFGGMVARHALANRLPESLVHRVIVRESRYNPRAVSRGNYGIMQIRLRTARAMGYTGSAADLLDPDTNMTYAVKYLAGAYRAAGGNPDRAVAYYARGYYYQAKAQGFSPYGDSGRLAFGSARLFSPVASEPQYAADQGPWTMTRRGWRNRM